MGEKAVTEAKGRLRAAIRAGRKEGFACGDSHSDALIEVIRSRGFKTVAAFEEFDNEPSLSKLRAWCQANSVQILLPRIATDTELTWSGGDFFKAEMIIVPALAAGRDGSRLGRGKGYYDRALEGSSALRVIAVHDSEVFDSVPSESHDERMDAICSCSGIVPITSRLK